MIHHTFGTLTTIVPGPKVANSRIKVLNSVFDNSIDFTTDQIMVKTMDTMTGYHGN